MRQKLPWRLHRLIVAALALGVAAAADEAVVLSEAEHAAWTAIGRVNVGGFNTRGTCTGTLIAPDVVLTAAHCVPERATRGIAPEKVHFVAGWFRSYYAAHRTAAEVHVSSEYHRGESTTGTLHTDVALLKLDRPIPPETVAPLPLGPMPRFSEQIEVLAYSNRRTGALARTWPCVGLALAEDVLGLTCPAVGGNSGAPALERTPSGDRVIGVMVARSNSDGAIESFAVRVPATLLEEVGLEAP